MSVILRLGAVNTENPYSRLVSDGTEYDPPVDMSPVADEAYHSPPQTYPGCFGLPYNDHNYGAQPPPTPPQTPPPVVPVVKENLDIKEEIVVTSDTPPVVAAQIQDSPHGLPIDPPMDEDVDDPTRCICDFIHDDGYMIQCDKCSVWQHIVCMGLDRDSIPDTYLCELCHPRPVDRARAKEFQIRKREFLKNLLIKTHDSSTDTDPEEVNNRLKAYGLDAAQAQLNAKPKQKVKMKKRKERNNSRANSKKVKKEIVKEKENTNKEINKKNKLLVKDFSSRTAQAKKEKLTKKIEKMRAERISKEMREDKFSSDDLKEDEKIINNTMNTVPRSPVIQDENAQDPWEIINTFNEWEQSYEVAKYNQYTTYVQEYLNSTYINGHHNDIADLVTDGLRVQRCHIKELKNKKKGLQASSTIPDGQPIIEVIGKVMTRQQYDKDNFGQRQLSPFVFFYGKVFDLDLIIDASDYGNDARFIRRSCQANAVVRHVVAGGQAHFITVATREILEDSEITIPFDYDYKKWNFCVECACLRNSCPVSRYQKRRIRFQKLKIDQAQKKYKSDKSQSPKSEAKSPVKSPTKSPIKSPVRTPEKLPQEVEDPISPQIPTETVQHLDPATPSPTKMVRRSQVPRPPESYADAHPSAAGRRSLRVPSHPDDAETLADPVTKPEPSNLRSSEVDPLTSPETNKESKDPLTGEKQDHPQEKKKLTREERKMEAIMKAFEKMEKRNARKQSVDHKVKDEKKPVIKKEPEKEYVVKEEETPVKVEIKVETPKVVSPVKLVLSEVQPQAEVTETVPEEVAAPESKDVEVERTLSTEIKEEDPLQIVVKQEIKQKSQSKGKKAKKTANRRRTRNSSGAASNSILEPQLSTDLHEDNSNSSLAMISCPTTPVPAVMDETSSSSTATTPSFKFLKTKRHLMNEWLIEKSSDTNTYRPAPVGAAVKSEPLEVAVEEEESMYVTCLPSPRNSMDRLRRNSQSCAGARDRHSNSMESTGSAKKRWLRQAMGEGTSDSGLASPGIAAGGMSPNPQAAMPSPGGSPPTDFVTPLKKRRLARESLSRESYSSESPCQTPTPSSATASTSGLNPQEEFAERLEQLREKNGINSFFAPVRSTNPSCSGDEDMEKPETIVLSLEKAQDSEALCEEPRVRHSSQEDTSSVTTVGQSQETTSFKPPVVASDTTTSEAVNSEEAGVSSCAEIDCSVGYSNTGSSSTTAALSTSSGREDVAISKTDNTQVESNKVQSAYEFRRHLKPSCTQPSNSLVKSSVPEERETRTVDVCSEQTLVCDGITKSANSEPDSSDNAGRQCSETPMEVECDSGSTRVEEQTSMSELTSTGEVDSTESSIHLPPPVIHTAEAEQSEIVEASNQDMVVSENEGCDSCFDERDKQVRERRDSLGSTSAADKLCSSSSPASISSVTSEKVNSSMDVNHVNKHSADRLSVVDSSTDKPLHREDLCTNIVTNSSLSITRRHIPEASGLDPIPSVSGLEQVTGSVRSSLSTLEPEIGLINSTIENVPHITRDSFGPTSTNITDSLLTSSLATIDTPSVPNRHLRFLTDCQLNTEMVVDSTTHYMPSLLTGASLVNSSGLTGVGTAYDSDSMDVTSGSDLTLNGMIDDTRKSDDSLSSFPDNLASRGPGDSSLIPKEKKRVSLQEYLKRKKEKTPAACVVSTVTSTCTSVGGATNKVVSSTTTSNKSPLRMSASMTLDKLPKLPSLPSLPMFEKTERKEFKSSSDLLSPIFNRKEKQEEVRKPMSLSERLRQEFGLDDSTDTDTDTENKDHNKSGEIEDETDVPPPPPPPPPQGPATRLPPGIKISPVANGSSAIPSLMSLKTFHKPLIKTGEPSSAPVIPTSHPPMAVPPPFSAGVKPQLGAPSQLGPSSSKPTINSMPQSLLNMLSNVKSPAQLQNDLTTQLNALKAQINKVQQSLPVSSSTSVGNSMSTDQLPVPGTSVNGASGGPTTSTKPQVFDYGHQSSANFMRQNSYPSSSSSSGSSSKHLYHTFNKSPSNINFGKTSPGYNKLSPGFSKHSPSSASHNSQLNNHGYHGNSHHSNMSSPGWNQKPNNSSHKHLSSSSSSNPRKHFPKQSSHKYS